MADAPPAISAGHGIDAPVRLTALSGWPLARRLIRGAAPAWWPGPQARYHALTTFVAAILALYVAFVLQLESPGSAMTTVVIVSGPLHGMVLSKGMYRFLGTTLGVCVSVLMIALFAQSPLAFMVALSIWMGLCVYVSSLLRHFRAYAAVLAGYTLSLVALPAVETPLRIFDLATSRIAVVTVGVVCCALVKGILSPRVGRSRLRPALADGLVGTALLTAKAIDRVLHPQAEGVGAEGVSPNDAATLIAAHRQLSGRLSALDGLIEAAATESAETAQEAPAVRLLVSVLHAILTLGATARPFSKEAPAPEPLLVYALAVRDLLRDISSIDAFLAPEMARRLAALRRLGDVTTDRLATVQDRDLAAETPDAVLDAMTRASRLDGMVRELIQARRLLAAIEKGRSGEAVTPVTYHRDRHQAMINAVRAGIATLSAGVFWIVTGWPSGATMMAGALPACALMGAADQPDRAVLGFAKGVALAAVAAYVCQFHMMAAVSEFPLLAACVAPFVVLGAALSITPGTSSVFVGFLIFFTFFAAPRNPMAYDLGAFLNTTTALTAGVAVVTVFFRVLWPVDTARVVRRLVRDMAGDVADFAGVGRRWRAVPLDSVLSRMQDRLARLSSRLANAPDRAFHVEGGLALLRIAHEVNTLRHAHDQLSLAPAPRKAVEAALGAVDGLCAHPARVAVAMQRARTVLLEAAVRPARDEDAVKCWRAAAACHEIARMIGHHLSFLAGRVAPFTPVALAPAALEVRS